MVGAVKVLSGTRSSRAHNLSWASCEEALIAEVSCACCAALIVGLNGSAVGRARTLRACGATRTDGDSVAVGNGFVLCASARPKA